MTYFQLTQYKTTSLNVPGGITNSQTTGIILTDVTNVDITKPGIVALTYAVPLDTTKVETISYTSINGSNELVGVVRGVDNFSAKVHNDQCVVAFVISASHINNLADGLTNLDADFLVEHNSNGTHASSIAFTTPTLTSPVINTGISGTAIVDEDTMVSDSATKVPTQQSVKAYVDGKVGDWTSLADTCVYASPSTFTIAGVDRTSIFRPGTRFYFTQTTGKYAVVEKSVFSTNTTVTITVNDNYVIANAAITAPYYSYALMPSGYPDYFQITPSTSNTSGFSAVNGYTYRYSMVGRAITISLQIGGTSNAASLTINLPATVANASGLVNTPVVVQDNGTWQASPGIAAPNPNTATLIVGKTIGSISGGTYAGFTSSGSKFVDCNLTYYV